MMFDSGMAFLVRPDLGSQHSDQQQPLRSPTIRQRTLKTAIGCTGIGLHSGLKISMILRPAGPDSGIIFRRTDIAGGGASIAARWDNVSDTRLNTCIANDAGVAVRTIEHLMAALAGLGIDNLVIDINGPEVPVMDGSAAPFVFLMECAGVVEQTAPRRAIRVLKPVVVKDGDKMASLRPADSFSVLVDIDFAAPVVGRQRCFLGLSEFKSDISRARTFGFEQEVAALRAAGLGKGGSLDNAVVISGDGRNVMNDEGLRYDDEFVRHKALDAIGDLYLAGHTLLGHYHGVRPGHALNNQLLREFLSDRSAWTLAPMDSLAVQPRKTARAAYLPTFGLTAASA